MKKFLAFLLLALPVRSAHALITDEGVTRENTVAIHFTTTVAVGAASGGSTSSFLLISLSTPSGFPHLNIDPNAKGEIDISHIHVDIDRVATSSGSLKIGVLTAINPSTASVTFFFNRSFAKNVSNADMTPYPNLTPSFFRCRVNPGTVSTGTLPPNGLTPYLVSNDTRLSTFIYNSTGTALPNPSSLGNIIPAVGDIIMEIVNNDPANTFSVNVDLLYHAERR